MQYTTLSNLKKHLWVTWTTRDIELTALIVKSSNMLEFELWQSLDVETVTRRVNGRWTDRVFVESTVNSVSSVSYTTDNGYSWSTIEVDYSDWYTVYLRSKAPKGTRNVKVVYARGYASVPADLEQFFLKYCESLLWDSQATEDDKQRKVSSKKVGNYLSVTYAWPEELSRHDKSFEISYDNIKQKYQVFSPSYSW